MVDGPLQTSRNSQVSAAINARLPDGISATELRELRAMAKSGTVALIDINATMHEVEQSSLTPEQKEEVSRALTEMRSVASEAAGRQSDGIAKTLGIIDTVNPFAYVRWLCGGTRAGCGQTW